MAADNPLRQVYTAIWSMLEAHTGFTDLVKTGNRIKYDGTTIYSPEKPQISSDDVPEVRVFQSGFKPHLEATTHGSNLDTYWSVQIASGAQEQPTLMDVQWAVYRALKGWQTNLKSLTWESKTFVTLCRPLEVKCTMHDKRLNRGIRGWSDLWAGEVSMWFDTADVAP